MNVSAAAGHTAVTFTSMPYNVAKETFEWQDRTLIRAACAVSAIAVAGLAKVAVRSAVGLRA